MQPASCPRRARNEAEVTYWKLVKDKNPWLRGSPVRLDFHWASWQHFTIPIGELSEDIFEEGLGFDGSSIRGWKAIDSSDMLVILPDPTTAMVDPFMAHPTLSLICDIQDPITREALRPRSPP